jgi:hypothetical protein
MDDLRSGNATPQHARAIGELGRAIGATLLLEMEYRKNMALLNEKGSAVVFQLGARAA